MNYRWSYISLHINPDTGEVTGRAHGSGTSDEPKEFKDREDCIFLKGENERWYGVQHLFFLGYDAEGNPLFEQRIPEYVEPEPTDQELANSAMLLGQTEIITRQNEQDEVLAAILLNGLGV